MVFAHLDLFSGIGGFALAAKWNGIKTIQFVELDLFCQKVLNKNFPGVPIHNDIKTFTYSNRDRLQEQGAKQQTDRDRQYVQREQPRPFLLTGGFPCQPFSCAGKRKGKEDDRFLWPEMLRVVSEAKPHWVIGENVGGFINMGLDDCISDLENQGYEVQAFVIPACAVNAPHRRDRVWIVGHSQCNRLNGEAIPVQFGESRQEGALSAWTDSHAADTDNQRLQGYGQYGEYPDQGASWSGAWQEPWPEVAARLCRVDDGLPRRMDRVNRLKALGNTIVPQVASQIIAAICEVERNNQLKWAKLS